MAFQRVGMVGLALSMAAGACVADVVPIGPFVGETSENFENLQPPGGYPGPFTILNGGATINDELANTLVFATSVASVDTNWVNFFPYDGFLMGLIPTGWTVITFDPPVTRFGGYLGSAANQSGGHITFKNSESQVIHAGPFTVPSLEWQWQGWQSSEPIARIEIHSSDTPGKPLVFDNLELSLTAGGGCYANCDASTVDPVLNVADFTCFLQRFAAGESYANCDESTAAPVLNVADFTCFLQRFAAGCP